MILKPVIAQNAIEIDFLHPPDKPWILDFTA
jgi:hypothetical protein